MKQIATFHLFIETAKSGSFTQIAKQLNLAPSTVSRQIAKLEEDLEQTLFRRESHQLELTDAGKIYFDTFQKILSQLSNAQTKVHNLSETLSGEIMVTAPHTLGEEKINPILLEFMQLYPKVKICSEYSNNLINLFDNKADIAIRVSAIKDERLIHKTISQHQYCLVGHREFMEKINISIKHPRDIQSIHCCMREDITFYPWLFRKEKQHTSILPDKIIFKTNSNRSLLQCVTKKIGIAMLPYWMVEDLIKQNQLIYILPDWDTAPLNFDEQVYLLYRPDKRHDIKIRTLKQFLIEKMSGINFAKN